MFKKSYMPEEVGTKLRVGLVGIGDMGAAVAARLSAHGVEVRTIFDGRSDASVARGRAAGMSGHDEAGLAESDFILSILPSHAATEFACRMAPALAAASRKPRFVDCNAISPKAVRAVAEAVEATGTGFIDACIVGAPPQVDGKGPAIFASGPLGRELLRLASVGLDVRDMSGKIGDASALKLGLSGITKGILVLAAAVLERAHASGVSPALVAALNETTPDVWKKIEPGLRQALAKGQRWSSEMEEIQDFLREVDPQTKIFEEFAQRFRDARVKNF